MLAFDTPDPDILRFTGKNISVEKHNAGNEKFLATFLAKKCSLLKCLAKNKPGGNRRVNANNAFIQ